MISKGLQSEIEAFIKIVDRARKFAKALAAGGEITLGENVVTLTKAIEEIQKMPTDALLKALEGERDAFEKRLTDALEKRREDLLRAAKAADWPAQRMQDHDQIGCVRVEYKHVGVKLRLGSEILDSFREADGTVVFERIQQRVSELKANPFMREEFFQVLKEAVGIARATGKDKVGKVPIMTLYPLVVLVRQTHNAKFLKSPKQKEFSDYSLCQFVYDLAQFGQGGWKGEKDERLSAETPNMATINKGGVIKLPALDGKQLAGSQIAALSIERG